MPGGAPGTVREEKEVYRKFTGKGSSQGLGVAERERSLPCGGAAVAARTLPRQQPCPSDVRTARGE
eukprot:1497044-Pleurochrysis_carterae.AAC.2